MFPAQGSARNGLCNLARSTCNGIEIPHPERRAWERAERFGGCAARAGAERRACGGWGHLTPGLSAVPRCKNRPSIDRPASLPSATVTTSGAACPARRAGREAAHAPLGAAPARADSPLRRLLDEAAVRDGLGATAFGFLPDLKFFPPRARDGGEVERVDLAPLPALSDAERRDLARIVGRSIALFSYLGVADLHWENLVIGLDGRGRVVFAPLDVEMILADLSLPTETKLLPDADPEYAEICRHACRGSACVALPGQAGEPVADLVAMAAAYHRTLAFLDRHAGEIAAMFKGLPELRETPIRVCLRGTAEYVRAGQTGPAGSEWLWPPLSTARPSRWPAATSPISSGSSGGRAFTTSAIRAHQDRDAAAAKATSRSSIRCPPGLARLRSPSRKKLREDGLFVLLGAFDHASFDGKHEDDGFAVTFRARSGREAAQKGPRARSWPLPAGTCAPSWGVSTCLVRAVKSARSSCLTSRCAKPPRADGEKPLAQAPGGRGNVAKSCSIPPVKLAAAPGSPASAIASSPTRRPAASSSCSTLRSKTPSSAPRKSSWRACPKCSSSSA